MILNDPRTGLLPLVVRVNGEEYALDIDPQATILDLLRAHLDLTGTKRSCGEQRCGSCTVLLNGLPVSACAVLAYEAHEQEVLTIEGLGAAGQLDPVQAAFIEEGAVQCGFCTPGMIMTVRALINDFGQPSRDIVEQALAGNICRCTGYESICRAIQRAASSPGTASEVTDALAGDTR
jgi:aerobic carbon-monoxide dehydrogenase small subunit